MGIFRGEFGEFWGEIGGFWGLFKVGILGVGIWGQNWSRFGALGSNLGQIWGFFGIKFEAFGAKFGVFVQIWGFLG